MTAPFVGLCGECGGDGYRTETGSAMEHACGGDERECQRVCPVEVPIPVQVMCERCGGSGEDR